MPLRTPPASLLLTAAFAVVATVLGVAQAKEPEKRLYRWTDADGKVHYTDSLPPEVVDKARQELSAQTGLVREAVGQAMPEKERRAAEALAQSAAEQQARRENNRRADEAKVSSFRTENELRAAYAQRTVMIDDNLASLRAAIAAQRGSLTEQLQIAGDAELSGRPVLERTAKAIEDMRREAGNQEQTVALRSAEKQMLQEELDRLVALFRERQAKGLTGANPP